jgi:hypothetical protein
MIWPFDKKSKPEPETEIEAADEAPAEEVPVELTESEKREKEQKEFREWAFYQYVLQNPEIFGMPRRSNRDMLYPTARSGRNRRW